ncbi:MAG: siderophore-interacting protein [Actinomycetota bacterium]|nr:siderophore-interacting protein [Actinomycetota bacterium]
MDRSDPLRKVLAHQRSGIGITRVPFPIGVRSTRLVRREQVTPWMLRLTVAGDGLAGFHTYAFDDHVRVVFPMPDGVRNDPVPNDRQMLDWPRPMPPTRKYTVRRFDPETLELDLDFVVHGGGLAATWAAEAQIGDEVVVAGPPGAKLFPHTYEHYVLAVDPTGLPAVARWLDEADWMERSGASATLLLDHDHPEETTYPLRERAGVDVRWLDRAVGSRLVQEAATLDLPQSTVVFAGGEAGDIKPLRGWAAEHGYVVLVTGYWKRGVAGLEDD